MSRTAQLLVVVLITLASGPAAANLRAPGFVPHSPSSALYAPAGGLTVTGEELSFDCTERCAVTAAYAVTAAKEGRLAFEFILPVKEQVAVRVGPAGAAVKVGPAEPLNQREAKAMDAANARSFRSDRTPLYRARFEATLVAGANRIVVTYSQPLGAYERDYGYFKKGRWVQTFQYEVWPLKEWALAPGFTASLTVTMPRPAPGWWKRTFGKVRSIACRSLKGDTSTPLVGARVTQRGRTLEYRANLAAAGLPDRLACSLGDEDLIR
jgi:hypothetical protein